MNQGSTKNGCTSEHDAVKSTSRGEQHGKGATTSCAYCQEDSTMRVPKKPFSPLLLIAIGFSILTFPWEVLWQDTIIGDMDIGTCPALTEKQRGFRTWCGTTLFLFLLERACQSLADSFVAMIIRRGLLRKIDVPFRRSSRVEGAHIYAGVGSIVEILGLGVRGKAEGTTWIARQSSRGDDQLGQSRTTKALYPADILTVRYCLRDFYPLLI